VTSPSGQAPAADLPQRVSTLELFFLAGDVAFRRVLGIGTPSFRALGAALALAAWPVAVTVGAGAGIALLTAVVAGALAVEGRAGHDTVEA
jgi:hypothetical protein